MANSGETYKCDVCGQVVKVQTGGAGTLVCCDQPMKKTS
ncbi:desulfoferrodoxin FeS4 iron-binding domain-containing protein [Desulfocurvibacter africanus]|uniref:Desulfoferrodoxin Dfx domain protein n=2 Tax=Desulfocurvibacter africanus TaxID=873 RepID=F3Z0D9_DESAF|nr:desulfoferrodoxin FeS4 iron-binding domain-containing protein [Desulfocurvibacter africanus]EGJ50949.1 Desulfoferrodoxin Dfx domain protein [Desulfocurvibacter africanus subsp. africanus str. Walvis Bay]EMG38510.1 desulfoferrodoxin FeS4 iron-binding domain containing protein [Desulfocurvibacter africanus PCS]